MALILAIILIGPSNYLILTSNNENGAALYQEHEFSRRIKPRKDQQVHVALQGCGVFWMI